MKKRLLCGAMVAMMVLSLAACNKKPVENKGSESAHVSTVQDIKYSDYLTIAQYTGFDIEADQSQLKVTDSEIESEITRWLNNYKETTQVTDRVTEDGDAINLDFSGLLDGVAFANGTATDYKYTIGGGFIESLDRQLIGLEVGKEYQLPCKFPENYGKEELNGKDVVFVVTVNYIEESLVPEYNDEFVKTNSEDYLGTAYATTAEAEKFMKEFLEENRLKSYNESIYQKAMEMIVDANDFSKIPQSAVDNTIELMKSNAQAEYNEVGASYGATTFEEFITKVYGYGTMDAFEEEISSYADWYIKEQATVTVIAEKENITVTSDEIDAYLEQLAVSNGYTSAKELRDQYGKAIEDDIRYTLLQDKVMEFLIQNQNIKAK